MDAIDNLRAEVNKVVAEKLPQKILDEEIRLHGRRKNCECAYHKLIPAWVVAHRRLSYHTKRLDRRLFIGYDNEYFRARDIFNCLDAQRKELLGQEVTHEHRSFTNTIFVSHPLSNIHDKWILFDDCWCVV